MSGVIKLAPEGDLLPVEAAFELRVTLTESQGDLLDKRDPLRKAERAKARAENSPSSEKEASAEVETETEADAVSALASPGNGDQSRTKKSPSRPAIPAVAAAEQELGAGFMAQARKRAACG